MAGSKMPPAQDYQPLIQKNLNPPLPTKAAGAVGFNVAFNLNL